MNSLALAAAVLLSATAPAIGHEDTKARRLSFPGFVISCLRGHSLHGRSAVQDPPKPAPKPEAEEKDLTPEEALKILKECQGLMEEAEALLNDSSRGKSLLAQEDTAKRIEELLKEDPGLAQKSTLEKIERLMKKSEGSQGSTVEKLADVIRRVKAQQQQGQGEGQPQQGPPQQMPQQMPQGQKPDQPQNPATAPYDPNRQGDPINKFRSRGDRTGRWGDLPPRLREAMLSGKRDLDQFPPEYQQLLKEYFKVISGE